MCTKRYFVANHKSSEKRNRQTTVKTLRNKIKTSQARGGVKKVREAIAQGDKETAKSLLVTAQSLLAKLAKSGVIKKNNAAKKTSALASQINKL